MAKCELVPKTFDVMIDGTRYGVMEPCFNGFVIKSLRYPIDSVCASTRDECLHLFLCNVDAFVSKEAP